MRKTKLKQLAPHEREVLESEILKEELIQKRFRYAIREDLERRREKDVRKYIDSGKTSKDIRKIKSN